MEVSGGFFVLKNDVNLPFEATSDLLLLWSYVELLEVSLDELLLGDKFLSFDSVELVHSAEMLEHVSPFVRERKVLEEGLLVRDEDLAQDCLGVDDRFRLVILGKDRVVLVESRESHHEPVFIRSMAFVEAELEFLVARFFLKELEEPILDWRVKAWPQLDVGVSWHVVDAPHDLQEVIAGAA